MNVALDTLTAVQCDEHQLSLVVGSYDLNQEISHRSQKLPYLKGVTFSKLSLWVSMLVFRGVEGLIHSKLGSTTEANDGFFLPRRAWNHEFRSVVGDKCHWRESPGWWNMIHIHANSKVSDQLVQSTAGPNPVHFYIISYHILITYCL